MTAAKRKRTSSGVIINLGLISVGIGAILILLLVQFVQGDQEASGEPINLSIALEPVASGLDSPVLLVGAGDGSGNRYVVEQAGRIVRLRPDGSVDPEPLLDIRDRVLHSHERGLLGLAFHPEYADNGRLIVAYSRRDDGATSISEFSLPGPPEPVEEGEEQEEPQPIESSERPLLVIAQPYTTHKGGMLEFDLDGMLLVSTGDGGSAWDPHHNAQDRASLLGKLLRIDVDNGWPYAIPEGNGFEADPAARGEVHAIGLRNPWRFSIDRATGDTYIGDVGQASWEEVNVLRRDERDVSFGWSDVDGENCLLDAPCEPAGHRAPAVVYHHVDGNTSHCAVVGGHAYRGEAGSLPDGTYLYADYCSGTIWGVPVEQLLTDDAHPAEIGSVDPLVGQVQGFGQDDAGELYVLSSAGDIFHISEAADPA